MESIELVMIILCYGNTLYFHLPNRELNKMLRLQNYAAETILGRKRSDSATSAMNRWQDKV